MGVVSQAGLRVRYAAHGLIAAWADHDQKSAAVLERVRAEALVVARALEPVRPEGRALAQAVISRAGLGADAVSRELAEVSATLQTEARAVLALLFDDPGLPSAATVLPPPGAGDSGILSTFPPGTARDYVEHLLTDHPSAWSMPVGSAVAAGVTGDAAPTSSVTAVAAEFDPALRDDIERMFSHPKSHAIQVHGPDVSDEALQARITWRKDPAGRTTPEHLWTLNPNGSIDTDHQVGAAAGRFDTYEALAKPLKAIIDANGGTIAGLHAYLSTFPGGRAHVFVPAPAADLGPAETTGFRGAGARTPEMAVH